MHSQQFGSDWAVKCYQAAGQETANQYALPLSLYPSVSVRACQFPQMGASRVGMRLFWRRHFAPSCSPRADVLTAQMMNDTRTKDGRCDKHGAEWLINLARRAGKRPLLVGESAQAEPP